MSRFTRKSPIPRAEKRLPLGYVPVTISEVSKPVEIEFDGEDRFNVKITFAALHREAELSIDCLCYIGQGSKLAQIFEAAHDDFSLDDGIEWKLEDLLHQEIVVLVEEKESRYGRVYRTISEFLPSTADIETVD